MTDAYKDIIHILVEPELGENTYIVERKNYVAVIDPGCEFSEIKAILDKTIKPLKYVLLTHGHVDHIKSANSFPTEIIYAHEEEVQTLKTPSRNASLWTGKGIKVEGIKVFKGKVFTLDDGITIYHTPGHTPGGVIIKINEALFSGDTLFYDSIGRTDLPGGNSKEIQMSLKLIDALNKDAKVYPGHGDPFILRDSYRVNYFLKNK
ncbi:MAG: MBL fold metallo-hydrolase [bacterium]